MTIAVVNEASFQMNVAEYLRRVEKACPDFWHTAVNPNPVKGRKHGGKAKAMGLKVGTPDLIAVYRGKPFGIELKYGAGRRSLTQNKQHDVMRRAGCPVWTCRSIEQVQAVLAEVGIPTVAASGDQTSPAAYPWSQERRPCPIG